MKNYLSHALAALLVAMAAPAFAAAPPMAPAGTPSTTSTRSLDSVDKSLDSISLKITAVKQCLGSADALKASLAEKKAEISEQNGGSIPAAYDDYIAAKTARLTRVRGACSSLDQDLTQLIDQTRGFLHAFPSNTAGISKRREHLSSLQSLANSLVKRLH